MEHRVRWALDALMLAAAAALLAYLSVIAEADAHEAPMGWSYEWACCSKNDCHPVDAGAVIPTDAGWLHVPSGQVVGYTDTHRLRQSKDSQFHVCEPDTGVIRCLYVPDMGF